MWSDVDLTLSVCVFYHGQQPMKMHTEVILLYDKNYLPPRFKYAKVG